MQKEEEKIDVPIELVHHFYRLLDIPLNYTSLNSGIPLYFIEIQIELSQLVEKLQNISAGILTIHDLININK